MFSYTLPNHKYVSLILFSLLGFALSLTFPNVFQSQGAEDYPLWEEDGIVQWERAWP